MPVFFLIYFYQIHIKGAEATFAEIATEMKNVLYAERQVQFQCFLKVLANIKMF